MVGRLLCLWGPAYFECLCYFQVGYISDSWPPKISINRTNRINHSQAPDSGGHLLPPPETPFWSDLLGFFLHRKEQLVTEGPIRCLIGNSDKLPNGRGNHQVIITTSLMSLEFGKPIESLEVFSFLLLSFIAEIADENGWVVVNYHCKCSVWKKS